MSAANPGTADRKVPTAPILSDDHPSIPLRWAQHRETMQPVHIMHKPRKVSTQMFKAGFIRSERLAHKEFHLFQPFRSQIPAMQRYAYCFLVVDMIPYFWGVCQEKLFNIIYTVFSFSVAFSGRFFKGLSKSYLKRIYFCTRPQKRSQNSNFDLPFTRYSLSFCTSNTIVLLNIF